MNLIGMKFIKNYQKFQWLGEGIQFQRRGTKIRYEAFAIGCLKVKVGDFVLIRNDDALDPEDVMSCFVAQVKDLFDTGDEYDPFQAQVQWFSKILELPTHAIRSLKTVNHRCEVVQDKRSNWQDFIDAETVFQKCEVLFLTTEVDCEAVLCEYADPPYPVFFCRYVFSGTQLLPVKDNKKKIINKFKISGIEENSVTNGDIFHSDKDRNSLIPAKDSSHNTAENMYCAFSVGSPEYPKVLIKKINEKILPSENENIRILFADPDMAKGEDFANIFLNKLKLEKEQHNENSEKKPIIHNLSQNTIPVEKVCATNGEVSNDSSIESATVKTPKSHTCKKNSTPLSKSSHRKLFAYSTRNSPRKNSETYCTPKKKPKVSPELDDLSIKHSTIDTIVDSSDEDEIAEEVSNDSSTESVTVKSPKSHTCKKNSRSLSKRSHRKLFAYSTRNSPRKNSETYCTPKKKPKVSPERDDLTLKHSTIDTIVDSSDEDDIAEDFSRKLKFEQHIENNVEMKPVVRSVRSRNKSVKNLKSENDSEYKIRSQTPKSKRSSVSKNVTLVSSKSHKKVIGANVKKSPNKYLAIENSDAYSTPKKKPIFSDVDNFRLTRSGRRVKPVNYSENIMEIVSTATPTKKKIPRFVRNDCSDDSDSSNFSAKEYSSDDSSVSGGSLHEEVLPNKRKNSLKKNQRTRSKKNDAGVKVSSARKNIVNLCIPERQTPLSTPKNALEESRQRLHVSAVPSSLPCRDEEYSDIYSFVKGCLCAQTGGCMYISGVPGTGKTATVHEVVRNLEEEKESGEVPIFTFVEVNGMWMTDPYQCYVQIFKTLTGKSIAPQQAADLLEKRFTERGPKKDAVVLLVDELDRLWTRKQTVMYNIFDWPTKKNSKLIVLAIANTMDLPERMMMNRISSRLGLTRKTFQPYTFKQLQEIIMSRIQELKVFDPDAVQLVARKVAAVSGDARRALDICRFATETIKVGQTPKRGQKILVGMEQVDIALQQMFSSPVISAIRSSSKFTKIFFQCLLSEFTRSGLEETTLLKVHRQVVSTCRFEGFQPPNSTEISRICADLATSHLILVDNFRNDLYMKIRLNVSSDDVTYALTLK